MPQIRLSARLPQQYKELAGKGKKIRVQEVGQLHVNSCHSWSWAIRSACYEFVRGRNWSHTQQCKFPLTYRYSWKPSYKTKPDELQPGGKSLVVIFSLTQATHKKKNEKVGQMPTPLMHAFRLHVPETMPESKVHWWRAFLYLDMMLFK